MTNCFAQINEPATTPVYDYLYRMAQKGLIDWADYQLPLDRRTIFSALTQLEKNDTALSKTEVKELHFYLQEYAFDLPDTASTESFFFLKKDSAGRFRTAFYRKDGNHIFLDPIVGTYYFHSNGKHNLHTFSGIRMAGYFGPHWGFNFSFHDDTEKGDTLNRDRNLSPEEGIITTIANSRSVNYSHINFKLTYKWQNGSLSAGKENLAWGYGVNGNIILSGKAPAYPYIKLDYQPWRWLHFSYFHGWLQSNIIDSLQSYYTGSGINNSRREIYRPKFIAQHAIIITPTRGLLLALGESVVYSDKLSIGYLIPISFFRAFDHYASLYNINAGDNSQFFGMISSRNQLKKTHLYAQIFIDEIRISKIFDRRERRNQLGYTVGLSRTDLLLPYLTAGVEYSRINPFVYNNLIPSQTYDSHGYTLGDWMGNNADRLYIYLRYTPLAKLKLNTWWQQVRKGAAGTLYQQYFQQPEPPFLFDQQYDFKELGATISYEWINRLLLSLKVTRLKWNGMTTPVVSNNSISFGITYGL